MVRDSEEIILAVDELRYGMRKIEERKDPWMPDEYIDCFSDYAKALVELLGNERANEVMSEAVITELGKKYWRGLRSKWISSDKSWIDLCAEALRQEGKEVP